jgi:CRP-like cAMP-binding protein
MGMQAMAARPGSTAFRASPVPLACSHGCRFFLEDQAPRLQPHASGPLLEVARRDTICSKGDTAHFCYKVIEGAVTLSHILADGHRQVVDIRLPGDSFGLETTETYAATAEAAVDTILLRCPRSCIAHLSDEQPEARRAMMLMLSRDLCAAQDHVAMLGHQGAKERVATYLLRLAEAQKKGEGELTLELPVGRQDLGDYLGLTIETTCRSLSDLKVARIISAPNRHQIVVHNLRALRAAAEGAGRA